MTAVQRWCAGLPYSGTRALSQDEVRSLSLTLGSNRRAAKAYRIFVWVAVIAVATGAVAFVIGSAARSLMNPVAFAFAAVGVGFFVAAGFGSVGEVLFGFHPISRAVFAVAWIAFGLGLLGGLPDTVAEPLGSTGGIVLMFGGAAMLIVRARDLRLVRSVGDSLQRDLSNGTAWQFSGELPEIVDDQVAQGAVKLNVHAIDVLPSSGIAIRIDGESAPSMLVLTVNTLGTPTSPPAEAAAAPEFTEGLSDGITLRQRHLQDSESEELRRYTDRFRWTILKHAIGSLYVFSVIGRGVDTLVLGRTRPGLNAITLAVVSIITMIRVERLVRHRSRLMRDVIQGIVLVVRATDQALEGPFSEEVLPNSRVPWTQFGVPAWWRIEKSRTSGTVLRAR
ncbi:MAG TPA: hypothetical protein VEU08_11835 [Vicinamibacterales bacterium]|nr:hypothetical protein [Vicinamibacterales bacterium]